MRETSTVTFEVLLFTAAGGLLQVIKSLSTLIWCASIIMLPNLHFVIPTMNFLKLLLMKEIADKPCTSTLVPPIDEPCVGKMRRVSLFCPGRYKNCTSLDVKSTPLSDISTLYLNEGGMRFRFERKVCL